MRAARRGVPGLLVVLSVLLVAAGPALADEYETAVLDRNVGAGAAYRLHARVLGTSAGVRPGGRGYARFELVNPTDQAHDVSIRLEPTSSAHGGEFAAHRSVRIEAQARVSLDMPLSNTMWSTTADFIVDGRPASDTVHIRATSKGRNITFGALNVGALDDGGWQDYLNLKLSRGRSMGPGADVHDRTPQELPDNWTMLSGFDLIIVRAGADGLTAERQDVLLRYVAGGGNLLVTGLGTQVSGPFVDLRRRAPGDGAGAASGFLGLGRWHVVDAEADARSDAVRAWLEHGARGVGTDGAGGILHRADATYASGTPDIFWLPLAIPGLGDVPVRAFFLLILLFVIFVGPVSYLYFRRRRRLAMLLVTIPVAGFLCAAIVLGYGILSEGFGIIGSARSFTVLDQRTQLAAVVSGRTLYAGLQPGALDPGVDSVVATASPRSSGTAPRLDLDRGQRLEGSLLPSRTPTPFVTTIVSRSRERLRFRRRQDGGYDVLSAPGLTPRADAGGVLLRAPDGRYFLSVGEDHDVLQPWLFDAAIDPTDALLASMARMPVGSGDAFGNDPWGRTSSFGYRSRQEMQALAAHATPFRVWFAHHVGEMPPGSYLARVRKAPVDESMGLDVAWRSEEHIVLGLLGPEDVTDG